MAVPSSKRRKLEHSSSDEDSQGRTDAEDSEKYRESSISGEEEEEEEDTTAKHKAPGVRQTARSNNEALYSGAQYKSSLFKLQIDSMLDEIRPNYEKYSSTINGALGKVKTLIEGIPESEPLGISEATKLMRKSHSIVVPYPDPKPKTQAYKLAYSKPARINVVGSYVLKTMVKSDAALAVDMTVTIPASILQEKDYLNYRYFYKRAYYLSCIAAGLQETADENFKLQFEYLNGNSLQPILVMKLGTGDVAKGKKFDIHILPVAPEGFFKDTKLRPEKNAIRPKDAPSEEAPSNLPPTPFYNATLQSDCTTGKYNTLFYQASNKASGFQEACILGRIWLRQRGFGSSLSKGGFGHFEWAALTALLLLGGDSKGRPVLLLGYSSYQLFKAIVKYLAVTDLAANPVVYQASEIHLEENYHPVFYDGPRGLNILFKMSACSYASLRNEANTSLQMLNNQTFDQFEATFILKSDYPLQRFDRFIRVSVPPSVEETGDHEDLTRRTINKLYSVLKEGLTDRVHSISAKVPDVSPWPLKKVAAQSAIHDQVLVGFKVNPSNIDRVTDRGPPAEQDNTSFRNFWGEKAELRRFKQDGIIEAVVWEKPEESGDSVFKQLVSYVLKLHLGIDPSTDLAFREQSYTELLPDSVSSTDMDAFNRLKEAYQILEKDVRDLEDLPLHLRHLSPIDSQLRYTSVRPPIFSSNQYLRIPAEVNIQFEGSARWPDDIVAIQQMKIAFLLKISELLQESVDGLSARVGLENSPSASQCNKFLNVAFLDIYYPSGAVFRLRIHNEREQFLLQRLVKDKFTESKTQEEARSALSIYNRDFIQLPLLNQSISTHCTRFPALSPTIRILKKWFGAHLLSSHVPDPIIELIAIRTFLQPFPFQAPSSAMTGCLRTLDWIGRWKVRSQPLIVDFSGTMTEVDIKSFETRLEAWRKIDPSMNRIVLIVGTNHDTTGTAFTGDGPNKVIASRIRALALAASKVVREKGLELDIAALFEGTFADYDFVISFKKAFTSAKGSWKKQSWNRNFKNLAIQESADTETIGFDPITLYLAELRELYGDCVTLFHEEGNQFIAGLWNPMLGTPRNFKVNAGFATKPCLVEEVDQDGDSEDEKDNKEERKIVIDRDTIIAEMARLGGDMVRVVRVKGS